MTPVFRVLFGTYLSFRLSQNEIMLLRYRFQKIEDADHSTNKTNACDHELIHSMISQ